MRKPWHATVGLAALLSLISPAPGARADAIVVTRAMTASTIAEIFVEADGVRVELEIGANDLPAFLDLLPEEVLAELGATSEPAPVRWERFFREGLPIVADDGPPLGGRVVSLEVRPRVRRDEITGEPLPAGGDEERTVFAVLEYPFAGRPRTLSFGRPTAGSASPASVGFVAYHLGLPVNDFRYLARAVLDLDWEDPWYSRFRSRNLRRTFEAPLHAFLYVEPHEVRVEIVARPRDLQRWVDLGLRDRETIPVELQPELERRAAAFLAEHLALEIDGETVTPTLDRIHFLRRTLRSSTVIEPREELDLSAATLGAIFVAPTRVVLPQEASLRWDLFDERIQRVPAAATDEAGPLPTLLDADDPVLRWQNFLRHPTLPTAVDVGSPPLVPPRMVALASGSGLLLSLLLGLRLLSAARRGETPSRRIFALAGLLVTGGLVLMVLAFRARLDDARAEQVVGALLHNVYRAFDFREEGDVYDVLERSVSGDLLARLYLETRRGLELASQGGARVKVKGIELVEVDAEPLDGGRRFVARCVWNVRGSVGHWGHVHQRVNRYEADLTVAPVDGRWKFTDVEIVSEERLPGAAS